jgi:hypothetical protein
VIHILKVPDMWITLSKCGSLCQNRAQYNIKSSKLVKIYLFIFAGLVLDRSSKRVLGWNFVLNRSRVMF